MFSNKGQYLQFNKLKYFLSETVLTSFFATCRILSALPNQEVSIIILIFVEYGIGTCDVLSYWLKWNPNQDLLAGSSAALSLKCSAA